MLWLGFLPFMTHAEPLKAMRWYKIYWGGFYVGDVIAEIDEQPEGTALNALITSRGLAKRFTNFTMDATSRSSLQGEQYIPIDFYTDSSLRKRRRQITLLYDTKGNIKEESVVPPDKRSKRPAVSEAKKRGSFNPLAATLQVRQAVINAMKRGEKHFIIAMYDGRRLANLEGTILPKEWISIGGKEQLVIRVDMKRQPIEGFTNNEYKRMKEQEPNVELYLSDDRTLYPLKIIGEMPIGYAVVLYQKDCDSADHCISD